MKTHPHVKTHTRSPSSEHLTGNNLPIGHGRSIEQIDSRFDTIPLTEANMHRVIRLQNIPKRQSDMFPFQTTTKTYHPTQYPYEIATEPTVAYTQPRQQQPLSDSSVHHGSISQDPFVPNRRHTEPVSERMDQNIRPGIGRMDQHRENPTDMLNTHQNRHNSKFTEPMLASPNVRPEHARSSLQHETHVARHNTPRVDSNHVQEANIGGMSGNPFNPPLPGSSLAHDQLPPAPEYVQTNPYNDLNKWGDVMTTQKNANTYPEPAMVTMKYFHTL